jgi:hypothetical protein
MDVKEHINHKETEISTKSNDRKETERKVNAENYMLTYK